MHIARGLEGVQEKSLSGPVKLLRHLCHSSNEILIDHFIKGGGLWPRMIAKWVPSPENSSLLISHP